MESLSKTTIGPRCSRGARRGFRTLVIAGMVGSSLFSTGCWFRNMHDQPKYKPLAAAAFFKDGLASRPLVQGTIARGTLHRDDPVYTGMVDGKLVDVMPVPLTEELLRRGQERYNIYCTVCHGATGEGDGMIVRRGFPPPPSYHIDRLKGAPDGHYFSVITNGFGRMFEYGTRVPAEDRWAIIAYIRALQVSHQATIDDVPAGEREKLLGTAQ